MTPSALAHYAELLYGRQWQTPLARALGVTLRTVVYWASGTVRIPDYVSPRLAELLATKAAAIEAALIDLRFWGGLGGPVDHL